VGKFCVQYTNGTDEIFDGEDIRYEEDYVVFTVSVNGREAIIRAVAVDKVIKEPERVSGTHRVSKACEHLLIAPFVCGSVRAREGIRHSCVRRTSPGAG